MAFRLPTTMIVSVCAVFVAFAAVADGQLVELVNVQCDDEVRVTSKCGAGGVFNGEGTFSGTMVCRNKWYSFSSVKESVCAPTVLDQVIGFEEDECGCCNGVCPTACSCVCDAEKDLVMVQKKRFLFGDSYECVTRSKASRWVGDGTNNYFCVSDGACPAVLENVYGPSNGTVTDTENTTEENELERRSSPGQ